MSKRHQGSSSNRPNEESKSPIELLVARYGLMGTIVTALIGLLGIAITAYFTYLGTRTQVIGPIAATQTAEARRDTPIQSTSSAPEDTPTTSVSTATAVIQPTSTTIINITEMPILTMTPVLTSTSGSTSQTLACITTPGGIVEVLADSLDTGYNGMALATGETIPFSSIKSFEVQVLENGQQMVTIILLDDNTLTGPPKSPVMRLNGLTTRGFTFSMWLSDVKRVEFRQAGSCQ